MKLTDEEIQQLLENGLSHPDAGSASANDVETYQVLFNALKKEPPGGLPYDFAAKLARQLQPAKKPSPGIKFYLLAIIAPVIVLAGAYIVLGFFDRPTASLIGDTLLRFKWAFIFVSGAFLIIQYLDQKLVKENEGL